MIGTFKLTLTCIRIIFCLVLLSSVAYAGGKWFVTNEGYRYYDNVEFNQSATWSAGADTEGRVQGKGTMRYFREGVLYCTFEGTFVNGIIQGEGVTIWTKGVFYEGEFLNGEFHGKGRLSGLGVTYEGDFTNGIPNGKGKLLWPNGNVYEGSLVNGKLTGKGILHYKDGFLYVGDFLNNNIQGYGTVFGPNGETLYAGKVSCPANLQSFPLILNIGEVIKEDEFQGNEGRLVTVEYSKKPTILWIWPGFTLEKFLKETLPILQYFYDNRRDQVNVYAVNFSSDWKKIAEVMNNYNCSLPVLRTQNNLRYSAAFPCLIIIDRNGVLRYRITEPMTITKLQKMIDSL